MIAASFWNLMVLTILAPAVSEGAETGAGLPGTIIGLAIAGALGLVAGLGGYWLWSSKTGNR